MKIQEQLRSPENRKYDLDLKYFILLENFPIHFSLSLIMINHISFTAGATKKKAKGRKQEKRKVLKVTVTE